MLIGFFPSPDIRKYERNNERRVYYLIIIFRRFSSGRTGSAQGNSLISIRENGRASNVTRLLLNAWTDSLFTKIILVRYKCDPYFDKRCTNVHTHTHTYILIYVHIIKYYAHLCEYTFSDRASADKKPIITKISHCTRTVYLFIVTVQYFDQRWLPFRWKKIEKNIYSVCTELGWFSSTHYDNSVLCVCVCILFAYFFFSRSIQNFNKRE